MTSPSITPSDTTLFERLPVAVFVCDAQGLLIRQNRKAAELWGPSAGPGSAFDGARRLFWPDGRMLPRATSPTAEALNLGRSCRDVTVRMAHPSGHSVWLAVSIDPIRNDAGTVEGAIHWLREIDEPKAADQDNQALLRAVVDATPECVKIVARDGTLLRMNPAGGRMVDAGTDETLEGLSVFSLIAPEHRTTWREQHERVCGGERLNWEFDIIGLRGTRRHVESHAVPFALPDGTRAHLAITRDITQRKRDASALRDNDRRFRQLLDALPSAIYTTDSDGHLTFFNRAAVEMSGRTPRLGHDRWCVSWRLFRADGTPLPHDQSPMAVALKERRPIRGEESIAERPDGTRVPFIPYPTPIFDADGTLLGAINILVDITDRKRAEEYSLRMASIVESSGDAIISKDTDGVINSWNGGAEHLFGYSAAEMIGRPVAMLIPADRQDEEPAILARIRAGERIGHYETVRVRKDGSLIDISLSVSPVRDAVGRVVGASKIARDISERRREEERRNMLINELNHRVKNTLATVQSLAAQTFRDNAKEPLAKQFEARLVALARAHDILTRESWEGADLSQLVWDIVSAICLEPQNRFVLSGPTVRLRPRMALSLSMGLHELCTNAAKYGSLSNESGRVDIGWTVEPAGGLARLRVLWRESGGPPVATPERQGFGTRLLERALARELDAAVRLSYPPDGVLCAINAPLT